MNYTNILRNLTSRLVQLFLEPPHSVADELLAQATELSARTRDLAKRLGAGSDGTPALQRATRTVTADDIPALADELLQRSRNLVAMLNAPKYGLPACVTIVRKPTFAVTTTLAKAA
jgi:hypothetical protein